VPIVDDLVIAVAGMNCRNCGERIERAVGKVAGVRRVLADHDADEVKVVLDQSGSEAAVRAVIAAAGFEVA
jgi:copper chaperone CopZ